jgi:hypothetical protein
MRKLKLHRETLRHLETGNLRCAQGGFITLLCGGTYATCDGSVCNGFSNCICWVGSNLVPFNCDNAHHR